MPRLAPEIVNKHNSCNLLHIWLMLTGKTTIACITWNFCITQNRRLPSSGDEDVRCCIFSSIDFHSRLSIIYKPGITLNGLDFSLKQSTYEFIFSFAQQLHLKRTETKRAEFIWHLLCQDCCDKCDLGDWRTHPSWLLGFCKNII